MEDKYGFVFRAVQTACRYRGYARSAYDAVGAGTQQEEEAGEDADGSAAMMGPEKTDLEGYVADIKKPYEPHGGIAEVAGKYAAAREALTGAEQAHAEASATLQAAQHAEREAWEALEALAGRTSALRGPIIDATSIAMHYARTGKLPNGNGGVDVIAGKIA